MLERLISLTPCFDHLLNAELWLGLKVLLAFSMAMGCVLKRLRDEGLFLQTLGCFERFFDWRALPANKI